ncbi:MAG TPA: serine/threonine-protein kinase, partial [Patescibacteria group bacterium]|nr:serine/threonine-protein kinase [Patescibacteria group bacterium]
MKNTATMQEKCPKCGTPVGRYVPGSLCARCLFEAGLSEESTGADAPKPTGEVLGQFGSYTLLAEIGRGGMGIVYRARDPGMNRLVAIKLIISGPFAGQRELKRFQAEAEAAARLDHPHIVPVYEFGQIEGRRFLSMKLIEGVDLVKRMRGVPMESRDVAQLLSTLARAIHHAHQRGILHRDLKPANVLMDEQDQPHVTDFGLAKVKDRESDLTLSSDVLGSPNYMAPEQAAGKADQLTTAADVYSLGAIMYETLTGRPPFKSPSALETMRMVIETDPIAPHVLYRFADRDLETICLKCLAKEPAERYGTALELAEELERWLRLEPIHARPARVPERVAKWMRRNPKFAALLVLLNVVFVAGISGMLLMSLRLASANHAKEQANLRLEKNVRDFEWQRIDELVATGKRPQALALLGRFLSSDPKDSAAARRLLSMLNQCNFALPEAAPLEHLAGVNSLELSSDGLRLLTAAIDDKARIWDWQSGTLLATFKHPKVVTSAQYLADGRTVLTACQDGHARIWDVATQKTVFVFPQAVHDSGCRVGPSRRVVALRVSELSIQLWDLTRHEPIGPELRLNSTIREWTFSPDGALFAVAAMDGTACIWRVSQSAPLVCTVKAPGDITRASFTPNNKAIALAWGEQVGIWDILQGTKRAEFQAHDGQVIQLGFTADGKRLVTTAYGQPLRIWDATNYHPLGQPIPAEPPLPFFRFSPDDRRIATGSQSGVCRLWDAFS